MASFESDLDQLTQFRPLSPPAERSTNSVTDFFMRFFDRGSDTDQTTQAVAQPKLPSTNDDLTSPTSSVSVRPTTIALGSSSTSLSTPSSPYMSSRSLSTVTSRITSLLTRNTPTSGSNSNIAATTTTSTTDASSEKRQQQRPLKDYNSSDFRQYWMPDSRGKECYECQEKFTTFRRRHHCRICGQIFCSRCCKQEIPGRLLGYVGDLRLCNYCCRVVLQYLNSPAGERACQSGSGAGGRNHGGESDVVQLRENLLRSLSDAAPKSANIQIHLVEEINVEDDSDDDDDLFDPLITPKKISTASEAWTTPAGGHLLSTTSQSRQRQTSVSSTISDPQSIFGIETGVGVVASKTNLLKSASSSTITLNIDGESIADTENEEPDWLKTIETKEDSSSSSKKTSDVAEKPKPTSMEPLVVDISDSSGTIPKSIPLKRHSLRRKSISTELFQRDETTYRKSSKKSTLAPSRQHHFASTSPVLSKFRASSIASDKSNSHNRSTPSNVHYGPLHKTFEFEAQKVLECLLRRSNVNVARWKPVLWPLTQEIAFSVQPQVRSRKDDMDALRYVHVKTLQSSMIPAAQVIFGTVCTKSVADKRMPKSFAHPNIFVVGGSIEYERVGGKFCPIDPIIMQEREYLQSLVRKIAALKPQILVVEKSVARLAQDYFLKAGLTLVFNMKSAQLRRIARSVEAGVAPSVEDQLIKPRMGRCGSFRTETYTILDENAIIDSRKSIIGDRSTMTDFAKSISSTKSKTLMFFEDCPPDLGCAIILTGPNAKELFLVKKVAKFMIGAAYSSKLEIEFLRAYQACIDAETILERPLQQDDDDDDDVDDSSISCLVCSRNDELNVESNLSENIDTDQSIPATYIDLDEETDKLRKAFVRRVGETSFTFSSFIDVHLPYLQTTMGQRCALRPFFNMERLYRPLENEEIDNEEGDQEIDNLENDRISDDKDDQEIDILETPKIDKSISRSISVDQKEIDNQISTQCFEHEFVRAKLTNPADSTDVRGKLAQYRAQSAKLFRKKLETVKKRKEIATKIGDSSSDRKNGDFDLAESTLKGQSNAFVDVLDPFLHRRIAVLYCSYSPKSDNAPGFCLKPRVFVMHFYGRFDVTLGDYLERYCFDVNYECSNDSCEASMVTHVRKLVHGNCCIEITTQNIDVPSGGGGDTGKDARSTATDLVEQHILSWNWCASCKTTTPATPMNVEFWHLSFARYLEYLFNGRRLGSYTVREARCSHCLFHQQHHYFAFRNSVVLFKCSPIVLSDVSFPPSICRWVADRVEAMSLVEETMLLSEKAGEIFSHMLEILCDLKSLLPPASSIGGDQQQQNLSISLASITQSMTDLQQLHESEQSVFRNQLSSAQALLPQFHSHDQLETNDQRYLTIVDSHTFSRHILARCVQQWNLLISDIIATLKKTKPGEDSRTNLTKLVAGLQTTTIDDQQQQSIIEKSIIGKIDSQSPNTSGSSSIGDRSILIADENMASAVKRVSADAGDRKQLTKILSTANLSWPFDVGEHFTILPNSNKRTPIVMRDDEISSIAAFALCSDDYESQRRSMREAWNNEGVVLNLRNTPQQSATIDRSIIDNRSMSPNLDHDDGSSSGSTQQHIELEFVDGSARFYCKIYYAEKFRLLRKLIFPDGEDAYARSISRCRPWQPKGGKSGANFYISHDKRFILKQLSRFEAQSILKIAPNYFQYMASSCTEQKLSALAKIFGVYRIGFRNPQTNTATKLDLLVMEYLFYNRNISQMYDLKGSLRNRLANDRSEKSRQTDLVLLDENLLKTICSNSFYLYPHSKSALNVAIQNDSEFLASNSIMDYSLLVGIDEEKKELVLGIIDFVRTFTWDKKLESWVKTISVTGQLPTVISPELYRDRFVEVMDIYFPVAPDQWTGLA